MRSDRAEMLRRLRFGGLLGIVWFVALLIPESTRLALIGQDRSWWRMLVLMVAASALVSLLMPVVWLSRRASGRVLASFALPALGALIYTELVLLVDMALILPRSDLLGHRDGPLAGLFVGTVLASFSILFAALSAAITYAQTFLLVVPLGFLHTLVLSRYAHVPR